MSYNDRYVAWRRLKILRKVARNFFNSSTTALADSSSQEYHLLSLQIDWQKFQFKETNTKSLFALNAVNNLNYTKKPAKTSKCLNKFARVWVLRTRSRWKSCSTLPANSRIWMGQPWTSSTIFQDQSKN